MEKIYFSPENEGFYGVYYPNEKKTDKVMIAMLGDSSDDRLVVSGVKWLHKLGCNVMVMSPDKQDYGHHNYPLERFEAAIAWLKQNGNRKIGIAGASTPRSGKSDKLKRCSCSGCTVLLVLLSGRV